MGDFTLMATNNFKAFALDPNANVMSQADWEALPALLSGFTAGKASSAQVNKAIRQATTIAALVGQFIANAGVDALDDGDVTALVTKFTNALTTNLSLGTASKKNIGTGSGQVPDMSSFQSASGESGYQRLPSGKLFVWGRSTISASSGNITLSQAFDNTNYRITVSDTGAGCIPYSASPVTGSTFALNRAGRAYDNAGTLQTITGSSAFSYIAIGN